MSNNVVAAYTWDYDNMLTGATISGTSYTYAYDPLGQRVKRVAGGAETRYIVAGGTVLAEMDASNNITAYYVYGMGLISKVTPSGSAYYYHYNNLGSTVAMTDSSGNIVNKYAYDPYGKVLSQVEGISNPFKYVGAFGVMDEGNGLLYMRARYYDPITGRFISKDPIGWAGGLNLYNYVGGNPVNWVDPWGLAPGDPYSSQHGAAYDATNSINPLSIRNNSEYGGMIYQNPNGTYSYTPPNSGGNASVNPGGPAACPSGTTPKAYYHTYGAYDPRYDNENFSSADKNYANYYSIDGYVGTPTGDFKYYNSFTGADISIGRVGTK